MWWVDDWKSFESTGNQDFCSNIRFVILSLAPTILRKKYLKLNSKSDNNFIKRLKFWKNNVNNLNVENIVIK